MGRIPRVSVFSWILYDFANTIYSMNVVTMYFSLWITVNLAREDLWVSFGNSTSMLLVALSMPLLGAISDQYGRRMPFLFGLTLGSAVATALIGVTGYLVNDSSLKVIWAVLFFIIANYAYQGALVFYNALLPEVSDEENRGRISGYGVSFGYIGAILGLVMVMPFAQGGIPFLGIEFPALNGKYHPIAEVRSDQIPFLDLKVNQDDNYTYKLQAVDAKGRIIELPAKVEGIDTLITGPEGKRRRAIRVKWDIEGLSDRARIQILRRRSGWGRKGTFIPTGMLFLLFSIPTFVFIKEKTRRSRLKIDLRGAFKKLKEGLFNTKKYPGVLRFLIAKFFYEEGIQTAIIFMAVYAVKVMGFPNTILIPFFMVTTTAAAFGSLLFGHITDRLGPKRTLMTVISGWVICLIALIIATDKTAFWVLGCLIGVFLGSTWTSARPLLISLVPREMLGEFFGLYSLSGKAAAIVGPYVWGLVVYFLGPYGDNVKYRAAVGSLALMMGVGLAILKGVPLKIKDGYGSL